MTRAHLLDSRFGVQRNLAPNPRPATATTGWAILQGTGGVLSATVVTTAGAGPQGRTGFLRGTVTTVPSTGTMGAYYRTGQNSLAGGLVGDTYTCSMWVRPPISARFRHSITGRAGGTNVGSSAVSAYVTCPPNVWTRLSQAFTADTAYDEIQDWVQIENGPTIMQVGQVWDYGDVLIQKGAVLNPFFDGAMSNAKWDGTVNASASTGNGWAGRI